MSDDQQVATMVSLAFRNPFTEWDGSWNVHTTLPNRVTAFGLMTYHIPCVKDAGWFTELEMTELPECPNDNRCANYDLVHSAYGRLMMLEQAVASLQEKVAAQQKWLNQIASFREEAGCSCGGIGWRLAPHVPGGWTECSWCNLDGKKPMPSQGQRRKLC